MAGGPEAWPEPEKRPQPVVAPNFSWKGTYPSLRVLSKSGDPLILYGTYRRLVRFMKMVTGEMHPSGITAIGILGGYRLEIDPSLLRWERTAPETWRKPEGKILFWTPDGIHLWVETSDPDWVWPLIEAGAERSVE